MSTEQQNPPPPAVRLVRGNADADELAAVLAVLHALATRTPPPPSPRTVRPRPRWTHRTGHPAAGTWRANPPTTPRP
ncbi:acyl-CoA carboxylase epsilon subunit [Streptomyces sp. NPDC005485]|uniref:acyl-CoA carboxylase epsilon subunit n=1 Tax=Streptomyces sp. NPDC005485 TaxID=3155591 RepID=UPI0033A8EB55